MRGTGGRSDGGKGRGETGEKLEKRWRGLAAGVAAVGLPGAEPEPGPGLAGAGNDGTASNAINAGIAGIAGVAGIAGKAGGDGGLGMQGWTGWCGAADGEGTGWTVGRSTGGLSRLAAIGRCCRTLGGFGGWRVSLRPVAKKAAAGIDSNQAAEGPAGRLTRHIPGGEAADRRLRDRGCVLSWAGRLT